MKWFGKHNPSRKMNLLNVYLKDMSGHIKSFDYIEAEKTFTIVFYDGPETFEPVKKLIFEHVERYCCEIIGEEDPDCIDLAIGFDKQDNEYCLHTDQKEIVFTTSRPPKVESLS